MIHNTSVLNKMWHKLNSVGYNIKSMYYLYNYTNYNGAWYDTIDFNTFIDILNNYYNINLKLDLTINNYYTNNKLNKFIKPNLCQYLFTIIDTEYIVISTNNLSFECSFGISSVVINDRCIVFNSYDDYKHYISWLKTIINDIKLSKNYWCCELEELNNKRIII